MSVLTDNTAKLRKILEKVENLPEIPQSVAQATPTISVSSGGLITATATQEAGAVAAGTKSATRQLTTKGGTTITPGTSEQTAVSAGTYVTGDIKVAGVTPGKQVAMGTLSITNSSSTSMAIQTGFNPANVMFSMLNSSVSVRIVIKDGSGTFKPSNDSKSMTLHSIDYSNGTATFKFNQYGYQSAANRLLTIPSGQYEWIATS